MPSDEGNENLPEDLSDLSELNFSFEESADSTTGSDEGSFGEASEASEHDIEDLMEVDIDSFNLEGDGDSPLPEIKPKPDSPPVPEPEARPPADEWFTRSFGVTLGPMFLSELLGLVQDGNLTRHDEVMKGANGTWIRIETVPALLEVVDDGEEDEEADIPGDAAEAQSPGTESDSGEKESKKTPAAKKSAKERKRKRKKRKRKPKKDEFLAEIFAEVFAEDGSVRSEIQRAPASSEQPPPVASDSEASASVGGSSSAPPAVPQTPPPSQGIAKPVAASAASTPPPMPPPVAQTPMQPPPRPPMPTPSKKKRSGAGLSLPSMDPKVLGIFVGVLALVGVGWLFASGAISVGGSDPTPVFAQFNEKYTAISGGTVDKKAWMALQKEFGVQAQNIAVEYVPLASSDPEAKKIADVVTAMIKVMTCGYDDAEARQKTFSEFQQARSALK